MAYDPATRQTFKLDEGDVTILFPANLSQKSIGILRLRIEMLAAELGSKGNNDDQSYLRGLAGLAAYVAN